jgi:hypothetical protein
MLVVRLTTDVGAPKVRIVRVEGPRALVEVPHTWADRARQLWNGSWTAESGGTITIRTHRTWGTLRLGKQWLRGSGRGS